ncbi:MAG: hypothetical protein GY832_36520 [Chloroflexi bacterium]|nr:hypothetical protein [Chloroflexota bacterium]
MLNIKHTKATKRCPKCNQIQEKDVLMCDCGYEFPKTSHSRPALARFPLVLIIAAVSIAGFTGSVAMDSIGVFLIVMGILALLIDRDILWEYDKWRTRTWKGIEAKRTTDWDILTIILPIILIGYGIVKLWIDLLR